MTRPSPTPTGRRYFGHRRIHHVTERRFAQAITNLAEQVRLAHPRVGLVVGIARGGTRAATALAGLLGIPSALVFARHNTSEDTHLPASGDVTVDLTDLPAHLSGMAEGTDVLVVDDICGSGATLQVLRRALSPHLGADTAPVEAVLCRNLGSAHAPDLVVWEVDDWVLFPWEHRPTSALPLVELPAPSQGRT
ncbi:phosphoribosyltransferase family protein [Nocardiopsis sp. NPDC006198]|uniref:phosphoribosyltransferase n=1 Tax=Nocardiopsis sp. NPDC006198 TaxID=3154472 RepID=UPI0033ACE7E2